MIMYMKINEKYISLNIHDKGNFCSFQIIEITDNDITCLGSTTDYQYVLQGLLGP